MLRLFLIFFRLGMFTLGGGYAMVPLIEDEIVVKNKWLDEDDFLDVIAMSQSLPGPLAVNVSTFVGYRIYKKRGAFICALGTVLPSFLIVLMVASVLSSFYKNPYVIKFFSGVRPAVAALIVSAVYRLRKGVEVNLFSALFFIVSVIAILVMSINPAFVILFSAISGIYLYPYLKRRFNK